MTGAPIPGRLALPDTRHALRHANAQTEDRVARRVLLAFGVLVTGFLIVAVTVPLTRTVTLSGQLVPERTVVVRAAEPGLVDEILVAAGDTVAPGQILARLRSPELDEAMRTLAPGAPMWPLLVRQARLEVLAPAWAAERPDGTVDPTTIFPGGVVLTDHVDDLRGARRLAGDSIVELAAADASGRVPLKVEGRAGEREAQRVRPGMPARITILAVPSEKRRQMPGTVRHVSPASGDGGKWHVEIEIVPSAVRLETASDGVEPPAVLRPGFAAEIAVTERRETLLQSLRLWLAARATENARVES